MRVRPREVRHRLHALEHRAARRRARSPAARSTRESTPWPSWILPFAASRPAEQRLEQRRLAGAVRPDERDVLAALERERRAVQQLPLADAQVEALDLEHRAPAARRLQELEPERARAPREQRDLVGRLLPLALEPLDLRQLRLRLLRLVLLRAEPLDEALEPLDVAGDALRSPSAHAARAPPSRAATRATARGRTSPRPATTSIVAVVTASRNQRSCATRITAASSDCSSRSSHSRRLDVEVVRRLVEQQQVGVAAERARERRARQLAAREGAQRPVEALVGEAEAAHDRGRVVAPAVAARVLEPRLRLASSGSSSPGRGRRPPSPARAPCSSSSSRDEVARAREHVLAQRDVALDRRPLVVQRDARALLRTRARRRASRSRRRGSGAASSCRRRSGRRARRGRGARR